ncbi:MAG: hypothetical protein IJ593_05010 [Lachnospiraceae bacterium]|nr:hypothetical protein [Lachnospiraceae bacterium]
MKINLNNIIDLTNTEFRSNKQGSSDGILPKTRIESRVVYLKASSYSKPFGIYGKEVLMELINSRIGKILAVPVLEYGLINANIVIDNTVYNTLVSISKDYKSNKYQSISVEKLYNKQSKPGEKPLDMLKRLGLQDSIYKQFVYDYVIGNLDRHGKNNDILIGKDIKLAPYFDNSLTFVATKPNNDIINKTEFNDEQRVNNFIGTQYLNNNLYLIDKQIEVRLPRKSDRQYLFQGLSRVTTRAFRDYVWYMLNRRVDNVRSKNIQTILWR